MVTMPPYDDRTTHWLDTLDDEARDRARRILAMPSGMAVAWVGVEVSRLRDAVVLKNGSSPNGRTQAALATLGGGIGGGGVTVALVVARMLGWN